VKKTVGPTLVLLSIVAVFAAGSAAARRQGIHLVGKVSPPTLQLANTTPSNPPMTSSQLLTALRNGNVKVNTVGGSAHFDANHLFVNSGDFMEVEDAFVDPRPKCGIILQPKGNSNGTVIVTHQAKANTPFVVDFQIANVFPNQSASVITMAGGSSRTWTVASSTHVIVVVYPTQSNFYNVILASKAGASILTGADVTDVTD